MALARDRCSSPRPPVSFVPAEVAAVTWLNADLATRPNTPSPAPADTSPDARPPIATVAPAATGSSRPVARPAPDITRWNIDASGLATPMASPRPVTLAAAPPSASSRDFRPVADSPASSSLCFRWSSSASSAAASAAARAAPDTLIRGLATR